ncbi:MAG: hypothetical protein HW414_1870, partial [Dehalococcoidia bacterium]|nr:hypothetical protein [Dehalococcoidia bacterium]
SLVIAKGVAGFHMPIIMNHQPDIVKLFRKQ